MCGIGGYSGTFDPERLGRANRLMAHRGPDDEGDWVAADRQVALCHRRLAIIDLSPAGHQPMWDEARRAVIVFNGEIYNYRDLRKDLEARGVSFAGQSDTEVLLKLYLTSGEAMLQRLNGIFAFAIWDARSRQLFLARDGLGVKPLYYASTFQGFAFASELKALLALCPDVARADELDPVSLHRYLSLLWCPGAGTPLKSVRKLQPGEAMIVRDGRIVRRWAWYQLPAERGLTPDLDQKQALSGVVEHLRTAVQRQMVADVPVGAFLSGGLDSSAVVAFAREVEPNIRCFTIELVGGQEEGTADDLPYARRVARHLGVALDVVRVDASSMAQDLATMVEQLDEPLADPAPLNVLYISRLARAHGIKVLLSGAGGDDLFTGYRRHRALMAEQYWSWMPRPLRTTMNQAAALLDRRNAMGRRLSKAFSGASLDPKKRLAHYFRWAENDTLFALYTPSFREKLRAAAAEAPLLEFLASLPPHVSRLERMLALEQRFFLADHNLIYTDKMSMASGVEVRVPFLDLELVDFAARVPAHLKQRGAIGKWVLKKAMEPYLPNDVIYRSKTGFGAPLRRWLRRELRGVMRDLLCAENLRHRGLFEPAAVDRLIAKNDAGEVDGAYTLFGLMAIELWCRRYLDHQPEPVQLSPARMPGAAV